ncbi:O-antigen ligase family protein [Pseudoalteromonas sp. SCSIO 43095]|uniref:O-antigen ligase family protein n=1 Tax=Pseudoalteromonas sp. SCSIO 43095 TaxID=2894202 RepID=UPI00202B3695|nr:O-antigen ligase family protein [Pseudoalteromonas sp. SCSIO 43095]URQ97584.1 O-antigen ligase family protein [Pseudoalteromonas sp. SCSIO 43095]
MLIRFSYLSLFFSLGILFFSRALTFLFEMMPAGTASKLFTPISLVFYLISLFIIINKVKYKSNLKSLLKSSLFPLLICLVAFISSFFSMYAGQSLIASSALAGTFLFAAALVVCNDEEALVKVVVTPLLWALSVSILFAIFIPSIGIDDGSNDPAHLGLWQGIFGFKNNLGRTAVFTMLFMLFSHFKGYKYKWFVWLIPIVCLLMSKSTTPLICFFVVLSSIYILNFYKRITVAARLISIPVIISLGFIGFSIITFIITDVFDKDLTGSGRSEMWNIVLNNIDYKLFGYGFGGVFWGENQPAEFTIGRLYYHLGHAHNGMIDALIDMGYVGLLTYPIVILIPYFTSIKRLFLGDLTYTLPLVVLTFLTFYSISGSSFLKQNNLLFLFYCVAIIYPAWRRINERCISYR